MKMMKQLRGIGTAVTILALVAGGCSAAVNPGGGPPQPPTPVKLRVLNNFNVGVVESSFADAVTALSKGSIQIEWVTEVAGHKPDSEAMTLDLVKSGQADIGIVGSRALTAYGVSSYNALIAPLLIDSYDLERQVLASPLVDEMAAGFDPVGLVGLGVLPGDLRVLLSRTKPFLSPADFAGASVAHQNGPIGDATFRALGATPGPLTTAGGGYDGFDAGEEPIAAIPGNNLVGRFVGSNVRLWPRPLAVVMSKRAFGELSADQQAALKNASKMAVPAGVAAEVGLEQESVGISCRRGVQFVQASDSDLAAIRTAVAPVYDQLEQDALTKRLIDAITQMKSSVTVVDPPVACGPNDGSVGSPTPTSSNSSAPTPSEGPPTALDGTWKACPSEQDILAAGGAADESRGNAGCWTLTFHRGEFGSAFVASLDPSGTCSPCFVGPYSVETDSVTMNMTSGDVFQFTWSAFKDTLTFKKSRAPGAVSPAPWLAKPFVRTGD